MKGRFKRHRLSISIATANEAMLRHLIKDLGIGQNAQIVYRNNELILSLADESSYAAVKEILRDNGINFAELGAED